MADTQPDDLLQFFAYDHLPQDLQAFSKPFSNVANWLAQSLPPNPERTNALRKLLESKDSAVRARLYKGPAPMPGAAPKDAPPSHPPPLTPAAPVGKGAKGK